MINYIAHWDRILIQSRSEIINELNDYQFRTICPFNNSSKIKNYYFENINWKISKTKFFDFKAILRLRRILDNLDPQIHIDSKVPDYLNKKVEFYRGDICNPDDLNRALKGINYIFHFENSLCITGSIEFRIVIFIIFLINHLLNFVSRIVCHSRFDVL